MSLLSLLNRLTKFPLETSTRICVDLVEYLLPQHPDLRHQLETILTASASSSLPAIDAAWEEETARRQAQDEDSILGLVVTEKGYDISKDLPRLRPNQPINDEIVNQYLSLVQKIAPEDVLVEHSFSNHLKFDRNKISKVIIPIYQAEPKHWTLLVLEKQDNDRFKAVLYDSFCEHTNQVPQQILAKLDGLEFCDEITMGTPNPQQNCFSQDCGLYILLCARMAADGKPMLAQTEARSSMGSFRLRVLAELLAGRLNPTGLDYKDFQAEWNERGGSTHTSADAHFVGCSQGSTIFHRGREVVDLISPINLAFGRDTAVANSRIKPAEAVQISTIDPSILSYKGVDSTPTETTSAESLGAMQSMFISSPESDIGTVMSLETNSSPGLPTPAPSRSSSPAGPRVEAVGANSHEPGTPHTCVSLTSIASESDLSVVSSDTTVSLGNISSTGCSTPNTAIDKSIQPDNQRASQSSRSHLKTVTKRRLSVSLLPDAKRPGNHYMTALFANPSSMAHMLQHALAAKRRSTQRTMTQRDLLGLWRIVNTNSSLQMIESRYYRERFAREWYIEWGRQEKRYAGKYMREVHGFQNCFQSAQKAAQRAKIWVGICDIFKTDMKDDCIVALCAVAELTSTTEEMTRLERIDFLQEIANQRERVLPLLRAVVPAFQFVLGIRPSLPPLLIEDIDISGDVIVKEISELSISGFQEYFKPKDSIKL